MNSSYINPKVTQAPSKIHGIGIFAKSDIPSGTIVFIKGGGIIHLSDLKEFDSSIRRAALPISLDFAVGPRTIDELSSSMVRANHSCMPNAAIVSSIIAVATSPIVAGEEITYDYERLPFVPDSFCCNCGTAQCRNRIPQHPTIISL